MSSLSGIPGQCVDAFSRCAPGFQSVYHTPPHYFDSNYGLLLGGAAFILASVLFKRTLGTGGLASVAGVAGAAFCAISAYHLAFDHTPSMNENQAEINQQVSAALHDSVKTVDFIVNVGGSVLSNIWDGISPHAHSATLQQQPLVSAYVSTAARPEFQ